MTESITERTSISPASAGAAKINTQAAGKFANERPMAGSLWQESLPRNGTREIQVSVGPATGCIGARSRLAFSSPRREGGKGKSEFQRPGRLHLRQGPHLGEHVGRKISVDLDQRNGIAAGGLAGHEIGRASGRG